MCKLGLPWGVIANGAGVMTGLGLKVGMEDPQGVRGVVIDGDKAHLGTPVTQPCFPLATSCFLDASHSL